ncbi:damage-inducible protein DinB [Flavobacterium zepuense]|uniref:Damage-inducible protein DinB n=1 Tax=Flavobacterium zepuense TaxID=2593302 RepID=A0A552V1H3_9FLAO|nr:DinB family protein [Flavobacterium zepuense]TRW24333.1 damage-inducible protein DinB [Flavobacterium zepuense]
MKGFFRELFEYTFHFNEKVIDVVLNNRETVSDKTISLICHTINTQEVWNSRILGNPSLTGPWDIQLVENLLHLNQVNFKDSLHIIDNFEFERVIDYTNSRGEQYENTVKDILFHINNHSTYHRGQIATDCKLHGIKPLVSDYIFYKRDSI